MTMIDEGDDYHDPTLPPPEQAVAFMAVTQDSFRDHVLGRSFNSTTYPENSYGYNKYRQRIDNGLQRIDWGRFRDRINSLTRMTPSHTTDPLIRKDVADSTPNKVEQAYFVSEGSLGIVDLGASLSVIGQSQFDDLCRHLPKHVLQSMKETPCQVKFRFGNDSSVTGTRAIFFPVGSFWIKVVVVSSNTPFLIANSVFRALGAVIDTEDASIYFKKLQCRLPIQLSDRRLYRLDLVQLLTCCPPVKTDAVRFEQTACHLTAPIDKYTDKQESSSLSPKDLLEKPKTIIENDDRNNTDHTDRGPRQPDVESQKANLGPKIPIKVKSRSFITMAQSTGKVSFDQLSDRLKALTTQEDEAQNIDDIMKFTYEELTRRKRSLSAQLIEAVGSKRCCNRHDT